MTKNPVSPYIQNVTTPESMSYSLALFLMTDGLKEHELQDETGITEPNVLRMLWERIQLARKDQQSELDWSEDSSYENGNYYNTCCTCKKQFIGHKRRAACKKCTKQGDVWVPMTPHNVRLHATVKLVQDKDQEYLKYGEEYIVSYVSVDKCLCRVACCEYTFSVERFEIQSEG